MFDSSDKQKDRPSVEEQYAVASGSSNLRVGNDPTIRTPGDLVAAAGMNKHRTGLALRRLMTEWDRTAKPQPMAAKQVAALAETMEVQGEHRRVVIPMTEEQIAAAIAESEVDPAKLKTFQWTAAVMVPNPKAGLVRVEVDGKVSYRRPADAAAAEAAKWHFNDLQLLLMGLQTLPAVRDALVHHCRSQGWEGDVHLVAQVLHWWLDPRCPVCEGRRQRVIAGTGRTGAKNCGACHGAGTRDLPHGWRGQKLLTHMQACLAAAARDLQEGTFRHERSHRNAADRLVQRLLAQGKAPLTLPPKVSARRYSASGRFHDGEYVTRGKGDVHRVTDMDKDGICAIFVCVVAPEDGSCAVGDKDLNLCRRYMRVEYPPKAGRDAK